MLTDKAPNPPQVAVGFRISDIETRQYAFLPQHFVPDDPAIAGNLSLQFFCDKERHTLIVSALAQLVHEQRPSDVFMVAEVACSFAILPDDWNTKLVRGEEKIILPRMAAAHFAMLTVGTLRGVLHSKAQNSIAAGHAILQAIDVLSVLPDEMQF